MLILTFAFILLLANVANAQKAGVQTGAVKGTVYALIDTTEKKLLGGWTKEKLPTANVLLVNPFDSSAVTGDATDLNGQYIISDVKPGSYILKVSYAGFYTNKMSVFNYSGRYTNSKCTAYHTPSFTRSFRSKN